ncbi:MAG: transposase [Candidatus Micrarchaeia archaeon]
MNGVANAKYKGPSANGVGHQYNFQHLVLVTKCRYKMFKNPKAVEIIRDALYDTAERRGMSIKEMSFGEDFAHIHMEVSIPNTMSIS